MILLLLSPFMITRGYEGIDAFRQSPYVLLDASLSMMIATFMNLEALKREELSYIAPLNAFVPIFTLLIAFVFLHESPPVSGLFGIVAIFLGAYIINLKPDKIK